MNTEINIPYVEVIGNFIEISNTDYILILKIKRGVDPEKLAEQINEKYQFEGAEILFPVSCENLEMYTISSVLDNPDPDTECEYVLAIFVGRYG